MPGLLLIPSLRSLQPPRLRYTELLERQQSNVCKAAFAKKLDRREFDLAIANCSLFATWESGVYQCSSLTHLF